MKRFIKWIENFWYHHKFGAVLWAILIMVVVVTAVQLITREKYDYTVYLYLSKGVSAQSEAALEKTLAEYGRDINGDKKVSVQILNISYDPSRIGSYQSSQAALLMGELQNADNYLFITDSYRFDELDEMGVFASLDFLDDNNKKSSTVNSIFKGRIESNTEQDYGFEIEPDELLLSVRVRPSKANDAQKASYDNAVELLKSISNEK